MRNLLQILIFSISLALLSACGGSGSSTADNASSQTVIEADSVSLRWIPPTTRSDGSYLQASELAGYRIYMGASQSSLYPIVDLINDNTNQYEVENLDQGSYYFAITAYDNNGVESGLSQVLLIKLT